MEILLPAGVLTALILVLTVVVMAAREVFIPSGSVSVTVNETKVVSGETGEKLLAVLNAAGLAIPSACAGAGICGLCRVRVVEGSGPPLATETARLSQTEIENGTRLACQTVLRQRMSVVVPDEVLSADTYLCAVDSAKMLSPLIREIVLKVPDSESFALRPGAYVQVTAPQFELDFSEISVPHQFEEIWTRLGWRSLRANATSPTSRAYSLANRPDDRGKIVLNVRLALPPSGSTDAPPGVVSSYLFGVEAGDLVEIMGPFGTFGAQESGREMVFIGGGVGVAPLRAIIHDQLEREKTERRISFWFGARRESDALYAEDFRKLAAVHENFSYHLALSEPETDIPAWAEHGFIHEAAYENYLKDHPAPEGCEYYLCGPPLMIQAVRAMLAGLGVEDDMIFFDDFGG